MLCYLDSTFTRRHIPFHVAVQELNPPKINEAPICWLKTMTSKSADSVGKKVCILTGASGTIGAAIGCALKASTTTSWHIIVIGRRPPSQESDSNNEPLFFDTFLLANLTDESSVTTSLDSYFDTLRQSTDASLQSLNRLDLLINCAGCSLGNVPLVDLSADTFREVLEVNLVAPFILSKWAMSKMASNSSTTATTAAATVSDGGGCGRIINIGSIAVEAPRLHSVPYTVSKVALSGLTRCLSIEGRYLAKTTKSSSSTIGDDAFVAVCQINPGNVRSSIMSAEEAARREKEEGFVNVNDLGMYIAMVANLPLGANVLESTIMPTRQPLIGRG
jgi:NAD(P)-dependent dehydrogenase (short-subunit alcohol dehydrogenase family)